MEEQYEVLKEMPRAKVGDILIAESEDASPRWLFIKKGGIKYNVFPYGFAHELIKDHWIKRNYKNWRAGLDGEYYYVCVSQPSTNAVGVLSFTDYGIGIDNLRYDSGNYFKSKETAEAVATSISKYFEQIHDWEVGKAYSEFTELELQAREKILEEDKEYNENN